MCSTCDKENSPIDPYENTIAALEAEVKELRETLQAVDDYCNMSQDASNRADLRHIRKIIADGS